jgi:hypothetical protein
MKRLTLIALVLLGGCVVQSFHPFYNTNAKVELPQAVGEWNLVAAGSDTNVTSKPWVFSKSYELTTYDEKNVPGKLQATFFKAGQHLFCDFEAGDIEDGKLNPYWILHVRPTHTVAKVHLDSRQFTLTPLSFDWFKKALVAGQLDLPHIKSSKSQDFLVTATPDQWAKFLDKYGANTNAFPPATAYVLKKRQ